MKFEYTSSLTIFGQAYGSDAYGAQQYNGSESTDPGVTDPTNPTDPNTGTTTAPNTGFFGLAPDAAIASASGALLIVLAIVGTIYVLAQRRRAGKKKTQG